MTWRLVDSGARAQALGINGKLIDDFTSLTPKALFMCAIPSPAATASLAMAKHIVETVLQCEGDLLTARI